MIEAILVILVIIGIGALLYKMFPKLGYRFRDIKNVVSDSISDPVKDHGHRIDDAKEKVAEARRELTEALMSNKKLEQKKEAAERDRDKFTTLAENAAKAGDESAVRQFLEEKKRAVVKVKMYAEQIASAVKVIEAVKRKIEDRCNQIDNADANKEILEAKLVGAKLQQDIAKTGTGLDDDDLGDLGSLEDHVNNEAARAEAIEEIYGAGDADLEAKYSDTSTGVDDEAAALLGKYKSQD